MDKEKLKLYKKGDGVSARRMNKGLRKLNDLSSMQNSTGSLERSPVPVCVKVVTEYADQVLCEMIDGSQILADKPWELRATVFDGEEHNDATYDYSSINEREATVGEDSEDQEIAPPYLANDFIMISPYVGFRPNGSSGWYDMNNGGRVYGNPCED